MIAVDQRLVHAGKLIWEVTHDTFFDHAARVRYVRVLKDIGSLMSRIAQFNEVKPFEIAPGTVDVIEVVAKPEIASESNDVDERSLSPLIIEGNLTAHSIAESEALSPETNTPSDDGGTDAHFLPTQVASRDLVETEPMTGPDLSNVLPQVSQEEANGLSDAPTTTRYGATSRGRRRAAAKNTSAA